MNQSTSQSKLLSSNLSNPGNPELHLVLGPMFAGKSTHLIKKVQELINSGVSSEEILLANHSSDTRYDTNKICSHDGNKIASYSVNNLGELDMECHNDCLPEKKYLLIDEAQFFTDLKETILNIMELFKNKERKLAIYVFGLDGDFKQQPFNGSQLLELIPYSSSITKLLALCHICQSSAPFSKRIIISNSQILVGGCNEYQPVCYKHL